jgi:hypothetical protein
VSVLDLARSAMGFRQRELHSAFHTPPFAMDELKYQADKTSRGTGRLRLPERLLQATVLAE